MGKETSDIISSGVRWKPGQFSFKHIKTFPKNLFRLGTGASDKKTDIFRRCMEIEGKARYSLRETYTKRRANINGRLLYFAFTTPKLINSTLFASLERRLNVSFCPLLGTVCDLLSFRNFTFCLCLRERLPPVSTAAKA